MASLHISPMSTRQSNFHGFSVGLVASELNRSKNLLFMVLHIEPLTSQSEGHSSVTLLGDRRVGYWETSGALVLATRIRVPLGSQIRHPVRCTVVFVK